MARPKSSTAVSPALAPVPAPDPASKVATDKISGGKGKKAAAETPAAAAAAAAATPKVATKGAAEVAPKAATKAASKTVTATATATATAPAASVITPTDATTKSPRTKKASDDEALDLHDFVKAFTNSLRKRIAVAKNANNGDIPADFAVGIELKDVRALNKLLNSLKNKVAPKPKGDRPPMNAYFYYQALRHLQINEKGLSPAETARISALTKEQEEREDGSSLTPYMIKSRMFNEDEYKKFDAKKKAELDATAKGFSLFKAERFADEEADKSKALPTWLALKDSERTGFEKRAKKVADDKLKEKETKAAAKEADKQAKAAAREAKAKAQEEARLAKVAAVVATPA